MAQPITSGHTTAQQLPLENSSDRATPTIVRKSRSPVIPTGDGLRLIRPGIATELLGFWLLIIFALFQLYLIPNTPFIQLNLHPNTKHSCTKQDL